MSTQTIRIIDCKEAARLWATDVNVSVRIKKDTFGEMPSNIKNTWFSITKLGEMQSSMERDASVFNRPSIYEFGIYESSSKDRQGDA